MDIRIYVVYLHIENKQKLKNMRTTTQLNQTETKVLTSCLNEIVRATGCEFGVVKYMNREGLSENQIKGYLPQLLQKGFIVISNKSSFNDSTFRLTSAGCNYLLSINTDEKVIENIRDIEYQQ